MDADYVGEALQEALGSTSNAGVLMIRDTTAVSGLFLVQLALKTAVQSGTKVVLVPVLQSVEKYKYVMKKLGVQLQQAIDSGQVVPVTPLTSWAGSQQQNGGESGEATNPLKELYQAILAAATATATAQAAAVAGPAPAAATGASGNQPTILIIDSLTSLQPLAASHQEWLIFLQYCRATGVRLQAPFSLLALVHGDVADDRQWVQLLEHSSQLLMDVQPLEGRLAEIDGQVTITRRAPSATAARTHSGSAGAASSSNSAAGNGNNGLQGVNRALGSLSVGGGASQGAGPQPLLGAPFVPTTSLYFRSMENSIKWIPHMTGKELLWG